jgi:hypothetical protein
MTFPNDMDFKKYVNSRFTDNELMRIINLYTRRVLDNGLNYYGKRDRRIMRKLFESMNNEPDFTELYKKMDYGLGQFQAKKRTENHD